MIRRFVLFVFLMALGVSASTLGDMTPVVVHSGDAR